MTETLHKWRIILRKRETHVNRIRVNGRIKRESYEREESCPVAFLIFFPAATGTGIISSYLVLVAVDRFLSWSGPISTIEGDLLSLRLFGAVLEGVPLSPIGT